MNSNFGNVFSFLKADGAGRPRLKGVNLGET